MRRRREAALQNNRSSSWMLSGASGLIGAALRQSLVADGAHICQLVRRPPREADEQEWRPERGVIDARALEGLDACVHLGGVSIAARWTEKTRRRILDSRVETTRLLASTLARLDKPPRVFVCASAVGYYGDRGDEQVNEDSSPGGGFLPRVCAEWEQATAPAAEAGIRVVNARFGPVLSAGGGALRAMLWPFRLGLGGPVGSGHQWMSWIALHDAVRAVRFLSGAGEVRGPVNVVAPRPVRNRDFARTLGRVLGRPAILPLPAQVVRMALGQAGDELLLGGQNVTPARLMAAGFRFQYPDLESALRAALDKAPTDPEA